MSVRRRDLNKLTQLLSALTTNNGGERGATVPATAAARRRRRRRRARGRQNAAPAPPVGQPGMPSTTNPRNRATRVVGNEGHMRIARDELCATLTAGADGSASFTVQLNPLDGAFGWLSGVAKSWERVVWHSVHISWRPAVGTTADGLIAYGFNWDPENASGAPKRAEVAQLSPVKDHPIWQATDRQPLVAPRAQLRGRNFYVMAAKDRSDSTPAALQIAASGAPSKLLGEVWCRYDLTLQGPKKA